MVTMSNLDPLIACAGRWTGKNRLQDPHSNSLEESPSTATVTHILGNRFVRLDYTWAYRGAAQEGSMLIGFDSSEATAHWIDTWHMSNKVLACKGPVVPSGELSVRGSYAAPPGPDWGWRTVITPGAQTLRIVMYNVTPDGQEALAVDAEYARASSKG
jgi:Protein of unknown function (DUF1579)